jgi:polar amino acid transport system permease protein
MTRRWWDLNRIVSVVLTVVAVAVIIPWAWHRYQTRPVWADPVGHYILHTGLKNTLRMAAFAVVGSAAIGIVLGTLLTIRFWPTRALIRAYIEVWRGLPIIITIFAIYFALPDLAHSKVTHLDAFQAATVGLILWGSAQVAEATRGAVQSIPREQHEAAAALGFGWVGRHVFVVLPQAFRRLLPPLVGLLVNVIQNTTIAAIIGVAEVLETGNRAVERLTFSTGDPHAFAIFGCVMVIFFVISFPLTQLARYLERRLV